MGRGREADGERSERPDHIVATYADPPKVVEVAQVGVRGDAGEPGVPFTMMATLSRERKSMYTSGPKARAEKGRREEGCRP